MFTSSQKERCISFLYLANDILQNSRRKGSEFVNEFWKVLPAALRQVYDNGDESGKRAATRLVSTLFSLFLPLNFFKALFFFIICITIYHIFCLHGAIAQALYFYFTFLAFLFNKYLYLL